jgi:hypothetical protein
MSRAISIDAPMQDVTDLCAKQQIGISVIEPLASGGTRVVLNNSDDAETIRRSMKTRILSGPVKRSPLYACRTPKSYL